VFFYNLRKSLNLSSTTENVDLFYNGLSDKYERLYPYSDDKNNEGGLVLLSKEEIGDKEVRNFGQNILQPLISFNPYFRGFSENVLSFLNDDL